MIEYRNSAFAQEMLCSTNTSSRPESLDTVAGLKAARSFDVSDQGPLYGHYATRGETVALSRLSWINLLLERDFAFAALELIADFASEVGALDAMMSMYGPVLDQPGEYQATERKKVAEALTTVKLDAQQGLNVSTELMMAAARAQDREMFEIARSARQKNILAKALGRNAFIEVAQASIDGKLGEQLELLDQVDRDSLRPRGYLNLLALVKRAKLDPRIVGEYQVLLLNSMRGSNFIDRPTDYTTAVFLITTLLEEPFIPDAELVEVVELVEKFVFEGENVNDPWELRKSLGQLRERLK